jgi:Family of unknown function (DUF6247)
MSAASVEPIQNTAELDLPDDLAALAGVLSVQDRARVAADLLNALDTTRRTGDLRVLQTTVWRWQHLARLYRTPQFHAATEWAASHQLKTEDALTLDEFNRQFGSQ